MSTIDEVLAAAEVVDAVCVIDGETRIISVPNEYKELGVESDEKVTRIKFQCPKIVGDNVNLTEYNLYINYRNAGNKLNSYLVEDVTVTGDTITFSWLLSRHVTEKPGTINYIVCAKKSDYTGVINEWNTKVATGTVGVGLEAAEEIEEQNIDIIEQILRSIVELENKVDSGGSGGYYAPSVDAAGNLSWTASKTGMPAVDGANIKGPQGVSGVYVGSGDMPDGYNVQIDPNGTPSDIIPSIDETLTEQGKAADAKATGDALHLLSEEIANLSAGGISATARELLITVLRNGVYISDQSANITDLETALGGSGGSGGETEKTLISISATYSGGDVAVGTAVTDLTGIVVTATYSDGSTAEVTGYALSGTIVEGSNTITVSYNGKTTTFTVTGIAESSGGEETVFHTVTYDFVNVTSNNSEMSVQDGSSFTATLTADDGYTLDSVTVTMGGSDVTADVYANSIVNIASVTGNVEIIASAIAKEVSAVLPKNGLLAFWDLRNATSTTVWAPTIGDETSYKLQSGNDWDTQTVDGHGVLLDNGTYGGAYIKKADNTGTFVNMEHGTVFTIVTLGYSPNNGAMIGTNYGRDGFGNWHLHAKYINAEGKEVVAKSVQTNVSASSGTYCPEIYRVDGAAMSLHLYGTQWLNEDGSSYVDFDHWHNGPYNIRSTKNQPSAYLTAVAIYNRSVSDEEVVEIGEYLKSLEVTV